MQQCFIKSYLHKLKVVAVELTTKQNFLKHYLQVPRLSILAKCA